MSLPRQIAALRNGSPASERLAFRRLRASDAEAVFAYAQTEEATRYLSWAPHRDLGETRSFIGKALAAYGAGDRVEHWPWALELRACGALAGCLGAGPFPAPHGCVEIGYVLAPPFWGRGLMTEAVRAAVDFLFRAAGVNRVQAHHFAGNEASGRVLEKAGFRREGLLRSRFWVRGQYRDAHAFAVLRGDAGLAPAPPEAPSPFLEPIEPPTIDPSHPHEEPSSR